jgi:Ca2+-binding RTX toxin-like protein
MTSQTCLGRTLVPGGECIARIVFTPSAAGTRTASLRLASSVGSSSAPLTGTGVMPRCFWDRATIVGTEGPDVINGTSGDDVVVLLGGDDAYNDDTSTVGDRDIVCGGAGDDHLSGNVADLGVGGNDRIHGGSGDDLLEGWSGDDRLEGGADDDFLDGGGDSDVCIGGSGADDGLRCESFSEMEFR